MIEWTSLDQKLEHPMQKQILLLLFRLLFELFLACLRVVASSLCCNCWVNVGDDFGDWTYVLKGFEVLWADFV